jgi:hypothetical protein
MKRSPSATRTGAALNGLALIAPVGASDGAGGHYNDANDPGCLYDGGDPSRRLDEPHRNHGCDWRVPDFMAYGRTL